MKQRGIGTASPLGSQCRTSAKVRAVPDGTGGDRRAGGLDRAALLLSGLRRLVGLLRGWGVEPRDQLVELQLVEPLPDGIELTRRELDQALALLAQLERFAQARLVRVEPAD